MERSMNDEVKEQNANDEPLCPECAMPFRKAQIRFRYHGDNWGKFTGIICQNGHEYFTEEGSLAIDKMAKEKGVWGKKQYG